MRRRTKIGWGILAASVAIIVAAGAWAVRWWNDGWSGTYTRARFSAPVGAGQVEFVVVQTPLARVNDVFLFVQDQGRLAPVGPVFCSDGIAIEKVFWSSDGSIVAVRSDRNPTGKLAFVAAYDFRQHQTLTSDDAKIRMLLRQRGGTNASGVVTAGQVYSGETFIPDSKYGSLPGRE